MPANWKQWEGQVVDATFPLRAFLGGSSQSAVYLIDFAGAEGDKAALKLIPADPQDAGTQLVRWKRVAELSHPHLIRLLQTGRCELEGVPLLYVVMELADENLSEILPQRALTAEETGEVLTPLLDALTYVHEKGFAHAAIKPANIMAVRNQVKISSDRLIMIGERNGAAPAPTAYDPPEIERGVITPAGAISPAGDVWSLGMTLVEVLTQSIPAQAWESPEGPPLPPDLPQPFLDIARHCLRREVKRRWTIAQIAERMRLPAAPDSSEETLQPSTAAELPKSRKSGRYVLPFIAAALLMAAILFGPRLLRRGTQIASATVSAPSPSPTQQISPTVAPPATDGTVAITPPSSSAPPPNPPAPRANPRADTTGSDAVVKRVLPEVSASARDTIQGTVRVTIRASVDSSGNVAAATFDMRGPSGYFADLAMQAARQWKFAPADAAAGNLPHDWLLRFEFTRTTINAFADPQNR